MKTWRHLIDTESIEVLASDTLNINHYSCRKKVQ